MLAVEKDSISLSRAEQLKHATGGAQFVSAEETLNQFRLIKDDNEIRLLKEAAKLADYGVEVGTAACVKASVKWKCSLKLSMS